MAQDIVPIELGLPQGDVVTLWAPRWREEGEDWEAFLGDEDDLYGFPDAAHLAAFVRTVDEHDLADHPAWPVVPKLTVEELLPDEEHQYDLVGVPELAAQDPDTWTLDELAGIVAIVRSLADVCELDAVNDVLGAAEGFDLLDQGTLAFTGRDGERRWTELAETIVERWDEVLDAIDEVVATPDVDEPALAVATEELEKLQAEAEEADDDSSEEEEADADADSDEDVEPAPLGFWGEVGIDPVKIITDGSEYYTLRCYLDDAPVFLGKEGKVDVFPSARALGRYIASGEIGDNDLAEVSTWEEVVTKATDGSLEIEVEEDNTYVLQGLGEDIEEGPNAIDPTQLDLAVELLTDTAEWAGDDSVGEALSESESLGWLISFVLRPDPTRLVPSAPFDAEVEAWQKLVNAFEDRLETH
ncbi:primosomal protein [Kibdelosporangium philippinense]|uniref:Primosomal protein n=1 Tax=Kibdelosporangium philippinense TaxID=211113 RepID=A0ABS8ZEB7_9PSEU|nr:primosomal protein [Kibdelosporangium philippinense]MCE7005897.1 primosomal protein [Kibdelosporangium philippinense]